MRGLNSFPLILRVKAPCFHLTIKVLLHARVLTLICACPIFKANFSHYNFPNANLLLNLRSPRDCGSSCRRAVRACGTSLVRWMALQCAQASTAVRRTEAPCAQASTAVREAHCAQANGRPV